MSNLSTTRAALFEGPGRPLRIETRAIPVPAGGEVLVRTHACTLCGSDLHTLRGRRAVATPTVLGHEFVGCVEAIGPDGALDAEGRTLELGDRIVASLVVPCGACRACTRGRKEFCTHRFKYGHESADRAPMSGGLAEHVLLIDGTAMVTVPSTISDAVAATATCAGATAAAAIRHGAPKEGDSVIVFGAGLLGLYVCALAREAGAASVLAVDIDEGRAQRARTFGATEIWSPNGGNPTEDPPWVHGGFDLSIEVSGSVESVQGSLSALDPGGRCVLVGTVAPTQAVTLDPEWVVRQRVSIRGVHNYLPEDLQTAVAALDRLPQDVDVPLGPLRSLEGLVNGVDTNGTSLRITVDPHLGTEVMEPRSKEPPTVPHGSTTS